MLLQGESQTKDPGLDIVPRNEEPHDWIGLKKKNYKN